MSTLLLLLISLLTPLQQETEAQSPSPDHRKVINIAIVIIDIFMINEVEQATTIDFGVVARWSEPELADPNARSVRVLPLNDVLDPRLVIINGRDLTQKLKQVIEIDREGNITYRQRYQGTLNTPLNLRELPLDEQNITLEVTTFDPDLLFQPDLEFSGRTRDYTVAGWEIGPIHMRAEEWETRDGRRLLSGVNATLIAQRSIRYFAWNLFLPLGLIVLMAYAVFWLDPTILPTQIALSTASVFALIFYNISLSSMIPQVTYLTRADVYALGCMLLVFFALYEAVMTGLLARRESTVALARRIDVVVRFLYPLGYLGVLLFALL